MSFFRYLRDNIRFIVLYFVLVVFLSGMAVLDGQSRMQYGNAIYTAAVSFTLFVACIFIDFMIRRRHAMRLADLVRSDNLTPVLPRPSDYSDELYAQLVGGLYAGYMEAIRKSEEDFRENKEFMVAWAHEIKTPITAAGLLLEGMRDEAERESLREELDRINDYVQKVLYLSRSDSFSRDYIIAEEALEPLVKENVKKHSALFIKKHIRVSIDIPTGAAVYTDRKWLLFIMDQLLSNALKYTHDSGEIRISARLNDSETVLCYRDNGRGIKAEDIERVFSKSFTGNNGRDAGSTATGLGLYLAQKLAHKLNHVITISSVYGSGTTTDIHFPLLDDFANLTKM